MWRPLPSWIWGTCRLAGSIALAATATFGALAAEPVSEKTVLYLDEPLGVSEPMTIRASLGELADDLRRQGVRADGLVLMGQSAPARTASGTEIVIRWYALAPRDGSAEWPLETPLSSRFLASTSMLPKTTRLSAYGDLAEVNLAVAGAIDAMGERAGDGKDEGGGGAGEAKEGQGAAATAAAAGSALTAGLRRQVAEKTAGEEATTGSSSPSAAAVPLQSIGRDGCGYRIDLAAGAAIVQTRPFLDGRPAGECTDSFDRMALQRDYAVCRASLSADTAVLAFKLYFEEGGARRFITDCAPDPGRSVEMTRVYDACPEVVSGQGAYRAYRLAYVDGAGVRQFATECAADTAQALPVVRDYAACAPEVDANAGTLRRSYQLVYTALDGTPRNIGGCTVDTAETVSLDRSYAACEELVDRGEVRRQFRFTYSDRTGQPVEVGACRPGTEATDLVPTIRDYRECEAVLDLQAGTIGWAYRTSYIDRSGSTRTVKDCAPDPASVRELSRDFSLCASLVDATAGTVRRQYQYVYVDREGALRKVGECQPDPAGTVTLQADYAACAPDVDGIQGLRWARFRPYFEESGEKRYAGECRRDDAGPLPLERSYQGCSEIVDAADETVQRQFRYRYVARDGEIVTAGDCRPDQSPAGHVPVQLDSTACAPVVDGGLGARWDQARPYYVSEATGKTWVAPCRPLDAPPEALQKSFEVCDELVAADGETVTAQFRYQYTDRFGTIVPVGDCRPDSGAGAFVALHADYSVCAPMVDLAAGTLRRQVQAWYWTAERQRRQVGDCAPAEGATETLGQDYGGCGVTVDEEAGTVRTAYRATWLDHQGVRQYGPDCQPDPSAAGLVPLTKDYGGCAAVIDHDAAEVWLSYRRAYTDGNGEVQAFGDCIEDRTQPVPLSRDYPGCTDRVELAEGKVYQRHQRVYIAGEAPVVVGECQEDPSDAVALQSGDPTCTPTIDLEGMHARRQHRRYYNDRIGQTHYVDPECLVDNAHAGWDLSFDGSRCSDAIDLVGMQARPRSELIYSDDAERRVVVEDCATREGDTSWTIDFEPSACGYRHDIPAGLSWAQHRPGYARDGERVHVGPCEDSEASFPHTDTREGCEALVDLQSGTAYAQQRTAILTDVDGLVGVTGCDPDLASVQDLQKAADVCQERTDDFDTGRSFAFTRWYHTLDGDPAYVTDCAEDLSVSYQHQFETTGWSNNDTTRESTERRVTYIQAPSGRVDVRPAAVLPNSSTLPYTYSRSEDRQNGDWTSDGCSVFWATDRHEIYLRRDGTEADYIVGAGAPQGPTDGCTYASESGHRYYHRGFDTSSYLTWDALGGSQYPFTATNICGDQGCVSNSNSVGTGPCIWPCTNFFTGYSKTIDDALDHCRVYPTYDPSTGTTWHRSPRACGKSIMRQTRQITQFPDGSRAFGPWTDTGQTDWLDLPIQLM